MIRSNSSHVYMCMHTTLHHSLVSNFFSTVGRKIISGCKFRESNQKRVHGNKFCNCSLKHDHTHSFVCIYLYTFSCTWPLCVYHSGQVQENLRENGRSRQREVAIFCQLQNMIFNHTLAIFQGNNFSCFKKKSQNL